MPQRKKFDVSSNEFRLATSPFYLMAHADFRYHEDMSAVLQKHGVSKSMYRILTVLREMEPVSIGAIAEAALIKRSTVSRILERMEEAGLITSELNAQDSRVVEVRLTQNGHSTLSMLTPVVNRQFLRAMEDLSTTDLNTLVRILQKISTNLNRLPLE